MTTFGWLHPRTLLAIALSAVALGVLWTCAAVMAATYWTVVGVTRLGGLAAARSARAEREA